MVPSLTVHPVGGVVALVPLCDVPVDVLGFGAGECGFELDVSFAQELVEEAELGFLGSVSLPAPGCFLSVATSPVHVDKQKGINCSIPQGLSKLEHVHRSVELGPVPFQQRHRVPDLPILPIGRLPPTLAVWERHCASVVGTRRERNVSVDSAAVRAGVNRVPGEDACYADLFEGMLDECEVFVPELFSALRSARPLDGYITYPQLFAVDPHAVPLRPSPRCYHGSLRSSDGPAT